MNLFRIVFSVLALSAALLAQEGAPTKSSFYPVSVWYSGGKARAPMLEERKAVLAFFQEVARHAEKGKAFYGWDLWSEPAALNWAQVGYKSEPMFCYCPASMERFRDWLQMKYGTLEKLNVAWHRTFTDWKQ